MPIIRRNIPQDGIEIVFEKGYLIPDKVKLDLKKHHFKWSRYNGVYWKKYTTDSWDAIHSYFNIPDTETKKPDPATDKSTHMKASLKKDIEFLVGLQRSKQNKERTQWNINLFKSSFFNKVKRMSQSEADEALEFLLATSKKMKIKPVFTKAHKIWASHSEGKAVFDKKFTETTNIDKKQLDLGIAIEMEHTKDKAEAEKIAMDHLKENPNYYTDPKPKNWAEKELKEETDKTIYYKIKTDTLEDYLEFLKELKPYVTNCKIFSAGIGEEYLIVTGYYDKNAAMHPLDSTADFDTVISDSKHILLYKRLNSRPSPEQRWGGKWVDINERIKHIEDNLNDNDIDDPDYQSEVANIEVQGDIAMQEAEQEHKERNEVGKIRPDFMQSGILKGREIQISMPNGEKRKAQFVIVELDNVIASHDEETFHSSRLYPKNSAGNNINDRNYKDDQAAQKAVMDYARELEPERLITTSRTPSGTPIVTRDGFVVSGNNRTMSLKLAAKSYPENYNQYKDFLKEELAAYGITFGQYYHVVDGFKFKNPVLVRIDYDFPEYTTQELAKYNKDTKKSERPIDKAIKLSNILIENPRCSDIIAETVGEYDTFSEFYANIPAQKKLAKNILECNLLTEQEMPAYFSDTTFTETGREFTENLLASLVLDREALLASEQPGVKSIRGKLITSLPVLMKNASLPEGSLKKHFNDAVIFQQKMTASGLSFADFIRQRNMFGETYDRKTVYVNRLIDSGKIKFKQAIEGYNTAILRNQGATMFGDKPTVDEIFNHWIIGGVSEIDKKLIESLDVVSKEVVESETKIDTGRRFEYGDIVEYRKNNASYKAVYLRSEKNNYNSYILDSGGDEDGEMFIKDDELSLLKPKELVESDNNITFDEIDQLIQEGYLKNSFYFREGGLFVKDHFWRNGSKAQEDAFYSLSKALMSKWEVTYNAEWVNDGKNLAIKGDRDQAVKEYQRAESFTGMNTGDLSFIIEKPQVFIVSEEITTPTQTDEELQDIDPDYDAEKGRRYLKFFKEQKGAILAGLKMIVHESDSGNLTLYVKNTEGYPIGDIDLARGLQIVNYISGYKDDIQKIVDRIRMLADNPRVQIVGMPKVESKPEPATINPEPMKSDILDIFLPKIKIIKPFISQSQLDALINMYRSEEKQAAIDIATQLAETISTMPATYETENIKENDKIIHLHYFNSGSDWYIIEKDKGQSGKDEKEAGLTPDLQYQAFGYTVLNGDHEMAEWGYISIKELIRNNVELDFYWTKKTFGELKKEWEPKVESAEPEVKIQPDPTPEPITPKNQKHKAYLINKQCVELLNRKWNDAPDTFTSEELELLKQYSSAGGLDEYFMEAGEKLHEGSLYEFYTPELIIQKMWGLAYKYGYDNGPVLEPAIGIGRFFNRKFVKDYIVKVGYEPNKYSARICKILYPEIQMNDGKESMFFEQVFIKNNWTIKGNVKPQYRLVIGNPPYGEAMGKYLAGMGEKAYTHAKNFIDYFIFRGLDLLEPGGLLIYIIGAEVGAGGVPWLDQQNSKCKEAIAQKANLIDAYRLPEKVFDRTDVVSDIVVFRRI